MTVVKGELQAHRPLGRRRNASAFACKVGFLPLSGLVPAARVELVRDGAVGVE